MVPHLIRQLRGPGDRRAIRNPRQVPIVAVALDRMLLCFRNGAACIQAIDFGCIKSQLTENLLVVLSNLWGARGSYLGNTMHLNGAADRGCQFATGTLERNNDVIRLKLWIGDDFSWITHRAERHVDTVEHLVPDRAPLAAPWPNSLPAARSKR